MAKYSYEFKMKVVQEYLDGNSGSEFLSKKNTIIDLIRAYLCGFMHIMSLDLRD